MTWRSITLAPWRTGHLQTRSNSVQQIRQSGATTILIEQISPKPSFTTEPNTYASRIATLSSLILHVLWRQFKQITGKHCAISKLLGQTTAPKSPLDSFGPHGG